MLYLLGSEPWNVSASGCLRISRFRSTVTSDYHEASQTLSDSIYISPGFAWNTPRYRTMPGTLASCSERRHPRDPHSGSLNGAPVLPAPTCGFSTSVNPSAPTPTFRNLSSPHAFN